MYVVLGVLILVVLGATVVGYGDAEWLRLVAVAALGLFLVSVGKELSREKREK